MTLLSFLKDERVVLFGLGVTVFSSVASIWTILEYYRDAVEIKPQPPKPQYITQATEDALNQHTLESLVNHYNFSIREIALKIVAGRAANSSVTISHLLCGITRREYEERSKCLRALCSLAEDQHTYPDFVVTLESQDGYRALVRSLEIGLSDSQPSKLDDPLYDEYQLREICERRCIQLVALLVSRYGVDPLIEAGFVDRWLVKQPWGDAEDERRNNFFEYIHRKHNKIARICSGMRDTKAGRRALHKARLLSKSKKWRAGKGDQIRVILEISMAEENDPDSVHLVTSRAEPVPRLREQSDEEQRLRRRHREAMVLNDGTHSLGRSDIIEREHDSQS